MPEASAKGGEAGDLRETIERLRAERKQLMSESRRRGLEAGKEWAKKKAGFTAIRWFVRRSDDPGAGPVHDHLERDGQQCDAIGEYLDVPNEKNLDREQFFAAFEEGVLEIWEKVRAEVEKE